MNNSIIIKLIHEESIAEKSAAELFLKKNAKAQINAESVVFCESPVEFARDGGRFSYKDGCLYFNAGSGADTLSALVIMFFEKYERDKKIPVKFTFEEEKEKEKIYRELTPSICDFDNFKVTEKAQGVAVMYWQNHTVCPDETVNILGINFENGMKIKLSLLDKDAKEIKSEYVTPLLISDNNIMFIIPNTFEFGIYSVVVINSYGESLPLFVNEPKIWWHMAEHGEFTVAGTEIRFFGNALCFGHADMYLVNTVLGEKTRLKFKSGDEFNCIFDTPIDIKPGEYIPYISNGLASHYTSANDTVIIKEFSTVTERTVNVLPCDDLDEIISNAKAGDVIKLSDGEYKLNRSTYLPVGVTLCGAGAYKTKISAYGTVHFNDKSKLTDLQIDSHKTDDGVMISIEGNATRLSRSLITQNEKFFEENKANCARIIAISDIVDCKVEDCEIYGLCEGMMIERCAWVTIRRCVFKAAWSSIFSRSSVRVIIENNVGTTVDIEGSASICPQISGNASYFNYIASNNLIHTMRNDREALTYDDHGVAYFGHAKVVGQSIFLEKNSQIFLYKINKYITAPYIISDSLHRSRTDKREWHGMTATVMTGRGICQTRNIISLGVKFLSLEKPFDIQPDDDALFIIGVYNGRHIIRDNKMTDAGVCVQTYPPNFEALVVGNTSNRAGAFTVCSRLDEFIAEDLNSLDSFRRSLKAIESPIFAAEANILSTLRDNTVESGNGGHGRHKLPGINILGRVTFGKPQKAGNDFQDLDTQDFDIYPLYTTFATTVKNNKLKSIACINMEHACDSTVIEHNEISNSDVGIRIGRGNLYGKRSQLCPRRFIIRKNEMFNVEKKIDDVFDIDDPKYKNI